ncbi:hypothetical protein [Dactylosporangium sp. NPDC049140]|uniref:hypothetical protein n=1 Tax=Dactylosporangium sp. NPDC049140 TaxID=3155647 RepID=UPI0033E743FC
MTVFGFGRRKREAQQLADAREEALRWYERLGGQLMNLSGDQPAVKQALVDASERYNASGGQLERATSLKQFDLARETALEGLAYIRAARTAMGLDPGPDLPPLAGARAGQITKEREVNVQGHSYRASPQPANGTPYYYPGGAVAGRGVPAGWYSEPWWKTALVAGAWGIGSVLVFDALFDNSFGDHGYDAAYNAGFDQGQDQGYDQGFDQAMDDGGGDGDGGDWDGGDGGGWDDGGGFDGGDFGGDF